ncbi:MAG TPA: cytochrome d ubiquinol oxidase subunit II [Terrimicrobiaceae bacterium]
MIEIWYGILAFTMIVYVTLDGRNFGAGILHRIVAKTPAERRQVIAAIGPLWSWHEVWLVAFGGVMFVAFPRLLGSAFSGYYLALFLVLWSLILRGISLEVGGHINERMWQAFWDFVFPVSNVLLGILFGTALGNVVRGVPLEENGEFHMAFFTHFGVGGNVGLLDWYTISMGVICMVVVTAHGATYLTLKTEGPVHDRCETIARRLWKIIPVLFAVITLETWFVRPELFGGMARSPFAWLAILASLAGALAVFTGLRQRLELRTFVGSSMFVAGLLAAGASAMFPVILLSTLRPENSLTAYNSSAGEMSLKVAIIWWPFAFVLSCIYFWFVLRYYTGKVKLNENPEGLY